MFYVKTTFQSEDTVTATYVGKEDDCVILIALYDSEKTKGYNYG